MPKALTAPILIFALIAATVAVIVKFLLPGQREKRIVFTAEPNSAKSFGPDIGLDRRPDGRQRPRGSDPRSW